MSPLGSLSIAARRRSRSVRPRRLSVFSAAGRISIRHASRSASSQLLVGLLPWNSGLAPGVLHGAAILVAQVLVVMGCGVQRGNDWVPGAAQQNPGRVE
jgi:hypothetical protein